MDNDIRHLRLIHDRMTQAELARRIGVSRQTVIAIEQGKHAPSLATALRIAAVFQVCVNEVFQLTPADGQPIMDTTPHIGLAAQRQFP